MSLDTTVEKVEQEQENPPIKHVYYGFPPERDDYIVCERPPSEEVKASWRRNAPWPGEEYLRRYNCTMCLEIVYAIYGRKFSG